MAHNLTFAPKFKKDGREIRAAFEEQSTAPMLALSIANKQVNGHKVAVIACSAHVVVMALDNQMSKLFSLPINYGGGLGFTVTGSSLH